jgi:DNA-binding beta-propeller fold protein YncE
VKTFLVDARPREAIFSPDGSQAYITAENGGTVSIVETKNHTVVDTIKFPRTEPQVKPKGAVLTSDGLRLYVATGRGNSVAVIDTKSLQRSKREMVRGVL